MVAFAASNPDSCRRCRSVARAGLVGGGRPSLSASFLLLFLPAGLPPLSPALLPLSSLRCLPLSSSFLRFPSAACHRLAAAGRGPEEGLRLVCLSFLLFASSCSFSSSSLRFLANFPCAALREPNPTPALLCKPTEREKQQALSSEYCPILIHQTPSTDKIIQIEYTISYMQSVPALRFRRRCLARRTRRFRRLHHCC